jgi:hypothetical protein
MLKTSSLQAATSESLMRSLPWKLFKTARLLTRPTLTRQDAPYPKQGRSE